MRMNPWKLTTFALLAGLVTTTVAPAIADRQPKMVSALGSLKKGRADLKAATADKGGHRVRAISLVEQAITEVEQGIKFDNKN